MNNEQFDRFLHSKLNDHQVIPPPELWEGIENKKPKRKSFIWWIAGSVLVFLSTGLFLILPLSKKDITRQSEITLKNEIRGSEWIQESSNSVFKHTTSITTDNLPSDHQLTNVDKKNYDKASFQNLTENLIATVSPAEVQFDYKTEEFNSASLLWLNQLDTNSPDLLAASVPSKPITIKSVADNLSLVITAGPMFASKHLTSKYNLPGDKKYIRYRNEAETPNSAWSASMLLQVDINQHFFIRTGVNYTSVSEKIGLRYVKAQVDGITTDTIVGTRNEITDPSQLLSVSEDEDFKLLADYTLRDKAEYRFLSFPLVAGLCFDKSRFSFYASAGLALNFSSGYSGKILAPDSVYLFSIQDVSTSPFNALTGFTLVTAAGFGYRVTDKIKLLFEPSYFRQLPDLTKTEYRLSQRFSGYGIQAGLIYKL